MKKNKEYFEYEPLTMPVSSSSLTDKLIDTSILFLIGICSIAVTASLVFSLYCYLVYPK
ncbi:MAG: hypothetical protein SPL03_04010 [Succinivibrio dextrinosolvens]|nr:hypothetical protein [Succinivibrio dextrinosolvens]